MKGFKGIFAAVMFAAVIAFMALGPAFLQNALPRNRYIEWMQPRREEYSGIIRIWHIAGFKPYRGGFGGYLAGWARKVEKLHAGVYFEVVSMTGEEAQARLARGESSDVLSFPAGYTDSEGLLELDGSILHFRGSLGDVGRDGGLYAAPYALSGYCLIANSELLRERNQTLPADVDAAWLAEAQKSMTYERGKKRVKMSGLAGDAVLAAYLGAAAPVAPYESFLNRRAAMAIADVRAVGDLERSVEKGKGFAYEVRIPTGFTPLVQLVGINKSIEGEKLPYALELIELLLGEQAQAALAEIGAFPAAVLSEEPAYDAEFLTLMEQMLREPAAPNAFLYRRYRDALEKAAQRALSGDAAGAKEFRERLLELVPGMKIR